MNEIDERFKLRSFGYFGKLEIIYMGRYLMSMLLFSFSYLLLLIEVYCC